MQFEIKQMEPVVNYEEIGGLSQGLAKLILVLIHLCVGGIFIVANQLTACRVSLSAMHTTKTF